MKITNSFLIILTLLALVSCKTQEDIRREKTVDTLNEEIKQTKISTQSTNSRFLSIEEQLSKLTGMVEESNHSKTQLQDRITNLEETNKKQVEYIKALTEKVNNQSGYIEEVIATLAKIQPEKNPSKKKDDIDKEQKDPRDSEDKVVDEILPPTFQNGMIKFKAKAYEEAKDIFTQVTENKAASKKNREGVLYYLGMCEFKLKNYEGAKVYFSKLFSEAPKSNFAPASLFYLAKSFTLLKSKEEAKMTYEVLMSTFPNSKEAIEASKMK